MPIRIVFARGAFAAALVCAGAAGAHVTANPNEGEAGGYFRTALRVGHGCKDSPTVAIRVKLPEGIVSVKAQAKPGWTVEIRKRKLDKPVDAGHGRMVDEAVDEVAWRGGPLAVEQFDEFGLLLKLPDGAGRTIWFPTVQECQSGVHRWIEIPRPDQNWGDLAEPAPFVRLTPPKP